MKVRHRGRFLRKEQPKRSRREELIYTAIDAFLRLEGLPEISKGYALCAFVKKLGHTSGAVEEAEKWLQDKYRFAEFCVQQDREFYAKAEEEAKKRENQHILEIKENTDPVTTQRASFWTNVRAGTIFFILGAILSPIAQVLLKHPLLKLDQKLHPEDFPKVEVAGDGRILPQNLEGVAVGKKEEPTHPILQEKQEVFLSSVFLKSSDEMTKSTLPFRQATRSETKQNKKSFSAEPQ